MKYISCNLCGSETTESFIEKDPFKIVKCLQCGLIFVNPRLSEEELKEIYQDRYFDGTDHADFFSEEKLYVKRFEDRMKRILFFKQFGNILDIGCATGCFLSVAKENGWDVHGIEISSFAAKHAQARGLNIFNGTLEDADFSDNFFDVITMWHVLEHIEEPLAALECIRKLLKESGLIVVEVPNAGCREFKKQKEHWHHVKPKEHIYYFTAETLSALLEKAGFDILKVTTLSSGTGMGASLKKAGGETLRKNIVKIIDLLYFPRQFLNYFKKVIGGDDTLLIFAKKNTKSIK